MIKEFLVYWQTMAVLVTVGLGTGVLAYHAANPQPEPYKESMTRATTITGRGQFRCQTGC
jgi:hypothetical protein